MHGLRKQWPYPVGVLQSAQVVDTPEAGAGHRERPGACSCRQDEVRVAEIIYSGKRDSSPVTVNAHHRIPAPQLHSRAFRSCSDS
jgi:hypothetical protein